jgi:hypothetical protein
MSLAALQFVLSLTAVFAGALITYAVNVRDRKRTHVERLFNEAIGAVTAAKAASTYPTNVPLTAGIDVRRAAELEQEITVEGYRRFVDLLADARRRVAAVVPYREEVQFFLQDYNDVVLRSDELIVVLRMGPRKD